MNIKISVANGLQSAEEQLQVLLMRRAEKTNNKPVNAQILISGTIASHGHGLAMHEVTIGLRTGGDEASSVLTATCAGHNVDDLLVECLRKIAEKI